MTSPSIRIAAALAVMLAAFWPAPAAAERLRVAVASNFRPAMEAIGTRFQNRTGHELALSFGSTGKHYAQIINGAPFDAFLAADTERPERLEREHRVVTGSRFTYAVGRLALWSADPSRVDDRGDVLRNGGYRHLAIANPDLAPYGAAARSVLLSLGLWEASRPKLVRAENIGQAYQFVVTGNAELGFVAQSQLAGSDTVVAGSAWFPPRELYPPIEQQAVLLRNTEAGRALMRFLRSEETASLLRAHGYDRP